VTHVYLDNLSHVLYFGCLGSTGPNLQAKYGIDKSFCDQPLGRERGQSGGREAEWGTTCQFPMASFYRRMAPVTSFIRICEEKL
jgi:hypothetical protein